MSRGNLRETLDQARKAKSQPETTMMADLPKPRPITVSLDIDALSPGFPMPQPFTVPPEMDVERGRPRTGKRSDPSYERLTVLVKKETRRQVDLRMLQEQNSPQDLSELVEMLLVSWAGGNIAPV